MKTPGTSSEKKKSAADAMKTGKALSGKEKRLLRMKRILAWAGIILLAVIYLATGILGFFGSPATKGLFIACLVCTVVVPVTLYAMLMLARLLSRDNEKDSSS